MNRSLVGESWTIGWLERTEDDTPVYRLTNKSKKDRKFRFSSGAQYAEYGFRVRR